MVLLPLLFGLAQVANPYDQIRERMEASLAKQRESVQKQFASVNGIARPGDGGFFTVPWPKAQVSAPVATAELFDAICDPMPPKLLDPIVESASQRHGVSGDLIQALIRKESAAKPCALSVKGAQGLMQLMPATAQSLGVADPFDPKENVEAGSRYLKDLLTRFNGDLALALGAYNAGPGAVQRYGGVPPYSETQNYVSEILKRLGGTSDRP